MDERRVENREEIQKKSYDMRGEIVRDEKYKKCKVAEVDY